MISSAAILPPRAENVSVMRSLSCPQGSELTLGLGAQGAQVLADAPERVGVVPPGLDP